MKELLLTISEFEKILKKYPDKKEYTFEFFSFFKNLQWIRTTTEVIPILEIGTIFKYEKPLIFHELRNYASRSPIIEVITTVEMDLNVANKKIYSIKSNS